MSGDGGAGPQLRRVMGPGLLLLFVIGDILGTGVYALTGDVANEVGGAAWAPFVLAFAIALVTAFSYLELVTKYPQAAGAALYTHKAFRRDALTFLVAFAVLSSGITSASTAARAFAANLFTGVGADGGAGAVTVGALAFMLVIAAVNLRGVGEGVRVNVVLTCIELSGILLVILAGLWAILQGNADLSRTVVFESPGDRTVFVAVTTATSLAFFAMVGFEDSVNMAEETRDPSRFFPPVMLTGLTVTGILYVLVSVVAVAVVPPGELGASDTPLVLVVERAAPAVPVETLMPFISMFAVANSALINMLMASRLLYGLSRQKVVPGFLGRVHPTRRTPWSAIVVTTAVACVLVAVVSTVSGDAVAALGGTTALLLLGVFAVVNAAVLVLRRDAATGPHFRAPTALPVLGVVSCAFFVTPWTGRDPVQYAIAGWLLLTGAVLWGVTRMARAR